MKDLFLCIKEKLLEKEPVVLVTVTKSSGSTPRSCGAHMLVGKGTDSTPLGLWGSIGGGIPEHLAMEEAASLLQHNGKNVSSGKYMLRPGEAASLGERCGGDITVFFRVLRASEPGLLDVIEKGIDCISGGSPVWFIMEAYDEISDDESYSVSDIKPPVDFFLGIAGEKGFFTCTRNPPEMNLDALLKTKPVLSEENGMLLFSEPLVIDSLVYIFGGGHIAQELVPLLSHLDFRCVVFDDREEFSKPELFPGAEKVLLGDFKHIGRFVALTENDYVVIVTRGHLWDLEAWAFALTSQAAYIGVIGSKTKHEAVKAQLRERGFDDSSINAARVHAPIGVDIKSETPAEIAVSIAAELILARARGKASI